MDACVRGCSRQSLYELEELEAEGLLLLTVKVLHDLKDPKLWELWYIPSYG